MWVAFVLPDLLWSHFYGACLHQFGEDSKATLTQYIQDTPKNILGHFHGAQLLHFREDCKDNETFYATLKNVF